MDSDLKLEAAKSQQFLLIAGAALSAAFVLFLLWYVAIRTTYAPAFTELKSADASLIIEELKRQKIPHELADNGATIMVPKEQVDVSRVNILGGDLPLKGTVGFELFNQSDIGLTEFAQKINYQRALQGELARTLMSLENVDTARVHLSIPDSGIFERDRRSAKASVTVAPKLGKSIDGPTVTGIQRLVASAVDELENANVVVLDAEGRLLSQDALPSQSASITPSGSPLEQEYVARVSNAIAPLIADPNVRVTVKIAQDQLLAPDDGVAPSSDADAAKSATTEKKTRRAVPIRITIILDEEVGSDLRGNLESVLVQAVDYDASRGDSLILLTTPATLPPFSSPLPSSKTVAKTNDAWAEATSGFQTKWIGWLLGLISISVLYLVFSRLIRRRAMSVAQRDAFAERLKILVDEQEGVARGTL